MKYHIGIKISLWLSKNKFGSSLQLGLPSSWFLIWFMITEMLPPRFFTFVKGTTSCPVCTHLSYDFFTDSQRGSTRKTERWCSLEHLNNKNSFSRYLLSSGTRPYKIIETHSTELSVIFNHQFKQAPTCVISFGSKICTKQLSLPKKHFESNVTD